MCFPPRFFNILTVIVHFLLTLQLNNSCEKIFFTPLSFQNKFEVQRHRNQLFEQDKSVWIVLFD